MSKIFQGWSALETRTLSCRDFWRQDKVKQDMTRYLLISALVLVLSRYFVCLSYFSLSQLFLRQEKITKCSFYLSLFSATRKFLIFQSFCVFVSIINSKCKMAALSCRPFTSYNAIGYAKNVVSLYIRNQLLLPEKAQKLKLFFTCFKFQSSVILFHIQLPWVKSLPPSQVNFFLFDSKTSSHRFKRELSKASFCKTFLKKGFFLFSTSISRTPP